MGWVLGVGSALCMMWSVHVLVPIRGEKTARNAATFETRCLVLLLNFDFDFSNHFNAKESEEAM